MRYSVFLEAVNEPKFQGYYYAHVPALDLTTHGQGVEGALAAAKELIGLLRKKPKASPSRPKRTHKSLTWKSLTPYSAP